MENRIRYHVEEGYNVYASQALARKAIEDMIQAAYSGHSFNVIISVSSDGHMPIVVLTKNQKDFQYDFISVGFSAIVA